MYVESMMFFSLVDRQEPHETRFGYVREYSVATEIQLTAKWVYDIILIKYPLILLLFLLYIGWLMSPGKHVYMMLWFCIQRQNLH